MIAVLLLAAASAQAPVRTPPEATPPQVPDLAVPELYTLSGGGVVQLLRRPELPLVRVEVSVTWPGLTEDLRTQLAAGLAGELLGDGTRSLSADQLAGAAELIGAQLELGLSPSRLWGALEVPVGSETQAIALLAQALREPRLARGEARRAARRWAGWRRDLWLDLRRSHARGEDHAWFPEGHPSRHRATPRDLRRLRARHARRVVDTILDEGQLYVAVAGATDPGILPALEDAFGDLDGRQRQAAPPPVNPAPAIWLVSRPGFQVAEITLMAPAPGWGDPALPAVQVLMGLFAGDFTSRVETELRERRGLTYGVDGELETWETGGRMRVSLEAQEDRTVEALTALGGQLEALRLGVSEDEVTRAERALILEAGRAGETNAGATAQLRQRWLWGDSAAEAQARLAAIAAVTPDDVLAAAARWLDPAGLVWVVTGDRAALEQPMMDAGLRPDVVIPARSLSEQP